MKYPDAIINTFSEKNHPEKEGFSCIDKVFTNMEVVREIECFLRSYEVQLDDDKSNALDVAEWATINSFGPEGFKKDDVLPNHTGEFMVTAQYGNNEGVGVSVYLPNKDGKLALYYSMKYFCFSLAEASLLATNMYQAFYNRL